MRAALPYILQAFFLVVPFAAGIYVFRLDLERLFELTGFKVHRSERRFYRRLLKAVGILLVLLSLITAWFIARGFGWLPEWAQ